MRVLLFAICVLLGFSTGVRGQLLFTSGTDTNQALFERINGASVPINTGLGTHNLPGLSRDGQFVTFSAPDPPQGNGINPSSDLYLYDRATRQTSRIVDNFSGFDGGFQTWNDVLSSQISPDGQFIAYGVSIFRGLGGTAGSNTNELNIVSAANGVIISNPTGARGATSDAFAAEFRGVSFFPNSQSFVTPLYRFIGISDPLPIELPTIVRFDRDPGSGEWVLAAELSSPQWSRNPSTFIGTASIHTYPSISPSGAGLAYFSVLVPDASTGTQPWVSRVVVANSDGSGATLLTSFEPGFVPTGLTWTADGTALVVSVSQQVNAGTGFIPASLRSQSSVFSVSTADGSTSQISELGNSVAPMLPLVVVQGLDLANLPVSLTRSSSGDFTLRASGVPDSTTLMLQRSEGDLSSFGDLQQVSGSELEEGVSISAGEGPSFFRLKE